MIYKYRKEARRKLKMESRVEKSVSNMTFGTIEQIVTLIFSFVTRTVFIKTLGAEYLGINGLFTNVLSILSITELGFGTAIIYSMYKPIKDNDKKKIAALMSYYKKIYNILAIVVLILGIAIIPILKYLINIKQEISSLIIYYLFFLIDSVASYLFANKVAIINANQNAHIISKYTSVFVILKSIIQVICLVIFKNYLLYLLIQLLTTITTNIYGAIVAKKMYPYAFVKEKLDKKEKIKLIKNVKSMAIYRFGGTIMNQTDNILMSIICGTINVGLYSNYNLITATVNKFERIIFNSITASVGNLNAGNENKKKLDMFFNIDFFSDWMFGFCSIAIFALINPFIEIWIGKEFLFNNWIVFSIAMNFYIVGILNVILVYRDTTGLFRQTKYVFLITAFINLVLSIILGKICGVFGILISSAIARLLTNCWFEPYKLFKEYFKISSIKYFKNKFINIFIIILSTIIIELFFYNINKIIINTVVLFILKMAIVVFIPNFIFYIFYRKRQEFKYFKNMILNLKKIKGGFFKIEKGNSNK